MKRKRYSEKKIISILKENQAGAKVADLSRRYGITENTVYRWMSKFGGGYPTLNDMLRAEGPVVNPKRTYRIYG